MKQLIRPAKSLKGTLQLPADKSISHRAVMFGALHEGVSRVTNFSEAADPHSTIACVRRLGVEIRELDESGTIEIHGVGRNRLRAPREALDCGNSGTTMRLLSGIIAGAGVEACLTGDDSLSARPMKRIIEPLTAMGARIEARAHTYAPLKIHRRGKLKPLMFPLPIASAQLKSCILLAGLFGEEPTQVIEMLPSRDHTERLLQLPTEKTGTKKVISAHQGIKIPRQTYRIPNDFSSAAYWLVAGSVQPNARIKLENVGVNPSRTAAIDILKEMGANISVHPIGEAGGEPVADIFVTASSLNAVEITAEIVPNCIDEIPILAVAMLFAEGTSRISGAGELRHKESDRLKALADLFRRAGADFVEHQDGLEVHGNPDFIPSASEYDSFDDHRIAMSAAVLGLMGTKPSQITAAECTAISYPSFWSDLKYLTN